jgi:hypothetical protein
MPIKLRDLIQGFQQFIQVTTEIFLKSPVFIQSRSQLLRPKY